MKEGGTKDRIMRFWKSMNAQDVKILCVLLLVDSWFAFWIGSGILFQDLVLGISVVILGALSLALSEILYWKYKSLMRKSVGRSNRI